VAKRSRLSQTEDVDRDELIREVYAHFGLAVYQAQVLEHGLANAMLYASIAAGRLPTLTDFDAFLNARFERTLGALVSELKMHVSVVPELAEVLKVALTQRNWLAHRYFRERAETFMSDEGCQAMLAELEAARDLFEAADRMLETTVSDLAVQAGVTDERVQELVAQITSREEAEG
jgi:hypothetical protein